MASRNKPSDQPQINFADIDFASDAISIKELRRLFPKGFEGDETEPDRVPFFRTGISSAFSALLELERLLARYAFDAALRRPIKNDRLTSQKDARQFVKELYVKFEIAQPHQARQLIRDLEDAAVEQARRLSPGRQV